MSAVQNSSEGTAPMTLSPIQRALVVAACALSAVTAVTVGATIHGLIIVPWQAVLFAGAFVVLDLVKYMLWPAARELHVAGRRFEGSSMIACAIALSSVSAWATSDMLTNAFAARNGKHQAYQQQLVAAEAARAATQQDLNRLDAEAATVAAEASALRARDFARAALNLTQASDARIDAQRAEARERLDSTTRDLAELRASPVPAGMPAELATLLGLGLALALEIVPALLLTFVRSTPAPQAPGLGKPQPATRRDRRALRIISRASAARTVAATA